MQPFHCIFNFGFFLLLLPALFRSPIASCDRSEALQCDRLWVFFSIIFLSSFRLQIIFLSLCPCPSRRVRCTFIHSTVGRIVLCLSEWNFYKLFKRCLASPLHIYTNLFSSGTVLSSQTNCCWYTAHVHNCVRHGDRFFRSFISSSSATAAADAAAVVRSFVIRWWSDTLCFFVFIASLIYSCAPCFVN